MTDNPYQAPQEPSAHRDPLPTYDPFALSRKISLKFWTIVIGILLLLVLLFA